MNVYTKRQRIAKIAKQHAGEPLTLLHHYIDEDWLTSAYHSLRKDSAPGVDRQTWMEYGVNLEENIKSLLNRAKSGQYKAPPVRRAEIPKPGSFTFLGFTHYWGRSVNGNWVVKRKTASKKFREKLKKISEWCRKNRHFPVRYQHEKLCQKIKGHYAYYGITKTIRLPTNFFEDPKILRV